MTSETYDGSAKVVPVESEEMVAFSNIHFREEDFLFVCIVVNWRIGNSKI